MKFNDFENNRVKRAMQKLDNHTKMGTRSQLSIDEVARLRDIVNGNETAAPAQSDKLFFGMYSLN